MDFSGFTKRLTVFVILIGLLFAFFPVSVRAEESDPVDPAVVEVPLEETEITPVNITVPVTVTMEPQISGKPLPGEDTFPVTVTALTEGAPGPYSTLIVCKGTGSADLIFGSYYEAGEYSYRVTVGKSSLTEWIVDDEEVSYTLTVTVTQAEDGTLAASYTVLEGEEISAVKTYYAPMEIDVEVKWPDGDERPVTVYLYETVEDEKTQIGKITVTKTTGWKGSFTHNNQTDLPLHPHGKYTVEEMDLYKFKESHQYNKNDPLNWKVTITNEKALAQTGLRTAPIFFLFSLGVICMAWGGWLVMEKKHYG